MLEHVIPDWRMFEFYLKNRIIITSAPGRYISLRMPDNTIEPDYCINTGSLC